MDPRLSQAVQGALGRPSARLEPQIRTSVEVVDGPAPGGRYFVRGRALPHRGRLALGAGDTVTVLWQAGQPVAILDHQAERSGLPPLHQPPPEGGVILQLIRDIFGNFFFRSPFVMEQMDLASLAPGYTVSHAAWGLTPEFAAVRTRGDFDFDEFDFDEPDRWVVVRMGEPDAVPEGLPEPEVVRVSDPRQSDVVLAEWTLHWSAHTVVDVNGNPDYTIPERTHTVSIRLDKINQGPQAFNVSDTVPRAQGGSITIFRSWNYSVFDAIDRSIEFDFFTFEPFDSPIGGRVVDERGHISLHVGVVFNVSAFQADFFTAPDPQGTGVSGSMTLQWRHGFVVDETDGVVLYATEDHVAEYGLASGTVARPTGFDLGQVVTHRPNGPNTQPISSVAKFASCSAVALGVDAGEMTTAVVGATSREISISGGGTPPPNPATRSLFVRSAGDPIIAREVTNSTTVWRVRFQPHPRHVLWYTEGAFGSIQHGIFDLGFTAATPLRITDLETGETVDVASTTTALNEFKRLNLRVIRPDHMFAPDLPSFGPLTDDDPQNQFIAAWDSDGTVTLDFNDPGFPPVDEEKEGLGDLAELPEGFVNEVWANSQGLSVIAVDDGSGALE